MKKVIFLSLALLLVATPVLASCPEGEVWQSNISYENGACIVSENVHTGTPNNLPWIACLVVPGANWYNGQCYWGGSVQNQCVEWEQVEVDNGMCVPDGEPIEEDPIDEEVIVPKPRPIGGLIHFNKPLIGYVNYSIEGDEIVASVLTTKPMTCGIITSEESQQFAISSDSTPIGNNDMELFGSADELYGYSEMYLGNAEPQTFSTLTAPKANYFRIMCDYFGKPIVSTEYTTVQ